MLLSAEVEKRDMEEGTPVSNVVAERTRLGCIMGSTPWLRVGYADETTLDSRPTRLLLFMLEGLERVPASEGGTSPPLSWWRSRVRGTSSGKVLFALLTHMLTLES